MQVADAPLACRAVDRSIYRWFNRLADHTSWAHGFFRSYANYGVVLFGALLLVAFVDARRRDDLREVAASVWAGAAALVALEVGQIIGGAIDRARPYAVIPGAHVLVDRTSDFSFPSDHATMAGAVAMGLLLTNRRWGVPAVAAAVLMAVTRVYVGAHYVSDVLAGLALGAVVAWVGFRLLVPLLEKLTARLLSTKFGVVLAAHPQATSAATPS